MFEYLYACDVWFPRWPRFNYLILIDVFFTASCFPQYVIQPIILYVKQKLKKEDSDSFLGGDFIVFFHFCLSYLVKWSSLTNIFFKWLETTKWPLLSLRIGEAATLALGRKLRQATQLQEPFKCDRCFREGKVRVGLGKGIANLEEWIHIYIYTVYIYIHIVLYILDGRCFSLFVSLGVHL